MYIHNTGGMYYMYVVWICYERSELAVECRGRGGWEILAEVIA